VSSPPPNTILIDQVGGVESSCCSETLFGSGNGLGHRLRVTSCELPPSRTRQEGTPTRCPSASFRIYLFEQLVGQ
jgi:hypothetical protein